MPYKTTTILWLLFGASIGGNAAELPVDRFAALPALQSPIVSPDGQYIATILNTSEVPEVAVSAFGTQDLAVVLKLESAEDRIEWIRWANDERLLVSASYSVDFNNKRIRVKRLYVVNRDGGKVEELRLPSVDDADPFAGTGYNAGYNAYAWMLTAGSDDLLSTLPGDPDHVLLQLVDERDKEFEVFKVDVNRNKFEKQVINDFEISSWIADAGGDVRLAVEWYRPNAGERRTFDAYRNVWYRESGDAKWQELAERIPLGGETFDPITIDDDGKLLVLSNHDLGRDALWRYDLANAKYDEVLFATEGDDVYGVIWDGEHRRVVGARYFDDYERHVYFDPEFSQLQSLVSNAFPDFQTVIAGSSGDNTRLVVAAMRDDTPVKFFWMDMKTQKAGPWFSQQPALENVAHARVQAIKFEARDGLPLTGYLTLPAAAKGKPRLVVLPHAGLWAPSPSFDTSGLPYEPNLAYRASTIWTRDFQWFDPFVQLLASRGYAVLQVNFRGSAGFGTRHAMAAYGEWGKAMQTDLYDAIDWLEKQGTVDTSRACIVGAGYGGYAALTAAFQEAGRFRCAVSMGGITDLADFMEDQTIPGTPRFALWRAMIGDHQNAEQRSQMESVSPSHNLDRFKAPLLLLHGTYDSMVSSEQSEGFARRAKSADVDVTYVELRAGTHFLDDSANRLTAFKAIDEFLARHLRED